MALKTYAAAQEKAVENTYVASGYQCQNCEGEMMIQHPIIEGWLNADTKNDLVRAVCAECGWRGWVPNDES